MATFNYKRSGKDGISLVKWNKSNRLARRISISFMFSLSFHLYVVDFNSNIKTLTTNITESNSYLRTRTTVPHVFWNPWSKNRRVPAVYRPLFWCGRVGLGRADLISDAQKETKKTEKRETKRKKDSCSFESRVPAALPHVLFRWIIFELFLVCYCCFSGTPARFARTAEHHS